jgi:hypothetical protein
MFTLAYCPGRMATNDSPTVTVSGLLVAPRMVRPGTKSFGSRHIVHLPGGRSRGGGLPVLIDAPDGAEMCYRRPNERPELPVRYFAGIFCIIPRNHLVACGRLRGTR